MDQTTERVREPQAHPVDSQGRGLEQAEQPVRRDFHTRRRSALKNPRVRLGLIVAAVLIVLLSILAWRYFSSYESTDDAQIDGHVNSIIPRVSGHVTKPNP
jgi:membrane fusion protein, multidrug efflux system